MQHLSKNLCSRKHGMQDIIIKFPNSEIKELHFYAVAQHCFDGTLL